MELPVINLLNTDDLMRRILEVIVRYKRIDRGELLGQLKSENVGIVDTGLQKLEAEGLIGEKREILEDWTTYYPTATGLGVQRKLN